MRRAVGAGSSTLRLPVRDEGEGVDGELERGVEGEPARGEGELARGEGAGEGVLERGVEGEPARGEGAGEGVLERGVEGELARGEGVEGVEGELARGEGDPPDEPPPEPPRPMALWASEGVASTKSPSSAHPNIVALEIIRMVTSWLFNRGPYEKGARSR